MEYFSNDMPEKKWPIRKKVVIMVENRKIKKTFMI